MSDNDLYNKVCYKNNFLKQVIFRIDFNNTISEIDKTGLLNEDLSNLINQHFPLVERIEGFEGGLKIDITKFTPELQNTQKVYRFQFYDSQRENSIIIDSKSITLVNVKYNSYEEYKQILLNIKDKFFEVYKDISIKRVGLRYINEIELLETSFFNWSKYLDKNIIGFINVAPNKSDIIRVINRIEIKKENHNLSFQYGLANPDYPAKIKRKNFVIDLDAYSGTIAISDIDIYIDIFHDSIQDVFEKSITDKLREVLNAE